MGNTQTIEKQLDQGEHPDTMKRNSKPVMFYATTREMLEKLLNVDGDIDIVYNNHTPLTEAVEYNKVELVEMLLLYGANPNPTINEIPYFTRNPDMSEDEQRRQSWMEKATTALTKIKTYSDSASCYDFWMTGEEKQFMNQTADRVYICQQLVNLVGKYPTYTWMKENQIDLSNDV